MKTILTLIFIMLMFGMPGYVLSADLLPKDAVIREAFKPGIGAFAGRLISVRDTSVIIHSDQPKDAYPAVVNLPLYKDDTLITLKTGQICFELNDTSLITISNNTRLLIDKSIYESDYGRSTFLSMLVGKARFWVFKLSQLRQSEFVIKTPAVYVGVRGSDFTLEVNENFTKICALDQTELEIISLYSIVRGYRESDYKVTRYSLNSLEKVIIGREDLTFSPEILSPEEIESLKKEFPKPLPTAEPIRKYDIVIPAENIEITSSLMMDIGFSDIEKSRSILKEETERIETLNKARILSDYPKEPTP